MNDGVQIFLKTVSLIAATTGKGPLQSELIRTMIDTINHCCLFTANKITFDQFLGIKKYLVFIPSVFFTISGLETLN